MIAVPTIMQQQVEGGDVAGCELGAGCDEEAEGNRVRGGGGECS